MGKRRDLKLKTRQEDYDKMRAERRGDVKVVSRMENGGMQRPGSNK